MIISSRVKYCELMADFTPFVLFGVELITVYSSTILPKRYEDFYDFHKNLSYFWNQINGNTKLLKLIPTLPNYSKNLRKMKHKFSFYIEKIVEILQNSSFNKFHPWMKLINKFFTIKQISIKEEIQASKIQNYYKKYISWKNATKSKEKIQVLHLPSSVFQNILSFLPYQCFYQLKIVSKFFLFSVKVIENIIIVTKPLNQSTKIIKLDFSYCHLVNNHVLKSIAKNCNGEILKEIKLSYCKHVNDYGIDALASKGFDSGNFKGGARGLKILALAHCNIGNFGAESLKKLNQFWNYFFDSQVCWFIT